jgi:predicted O-methyltransferase YrrM
VTRVAGRSRVDATSTRGHGARWWSALKACIPEPIVSFYRYRHRRAAIDRVVEIYGRGARPTLAERRLDDLIPSGDTALVQIPIVGIVSADEWTLPMAELVTLAAICARARPRRIFEIGTYRGLSTLVMALNSPPDAEIFTLDLHPSTRQAYAHAMGFGRFPDFAVGEHFADHSVASRIHQVFGDSRTLDPEAFRGRVDLVFIDANHTYDFVWADSEHALAMLRPGGLIVWDDYVWTERAPECAGVTRYVNELAVSRSIRRIAGTRLAMLVDGPSPP